jgi:hypothetical protein
MTLVRGPNLDLVITDKALSALGAPGSVLLRVWLLLELHGRRRTPAEYELGVAPADAGPAEVPQPSSARAVHSGILMTTLPISFIAL